MTLRQLLAALWLTGQPETILRLLTDPASDGPAKILAEGGTFMWEQWNPGCATAGCSGAQVSQSSSESFSHGWGAAGITGILEGLLGVEVTGPGASTVRITVPDSGLRHASGTEWTERGRSPCPGRDPATTSHSTSRFRSTSPRPSSCRPASIRSAPATRTWPAEEHP